MVTCYLYRQQFGYLRSIAFKEKANGRLANSPTFFFPSYFRIMSGCVLLYDNSLHLLWLGWGELGCLA